ncbi:MAG TPA: hypothetical protein VNV42_01735 [Solirubrobacteraceae bacterium]|jgi:hypothetical protein|nr:hypothetical protein [Solirubrobacteraceae bacterium]
MIRLPTTAAPLVAVAACALAAAGAPAGATLARSTVTPLAQSPNLWATVDVCNAPHHPHTIGIRGSMPGDGRRRDAMYMRFRVQSFDATTKQWVELGGAESAFVSVGSAVGTRQAGRTFEFKPTPNPYMLRGLVEFQWRRAGHVVHLASIPTTARHTSLAGAEPKGFSAATCELK